MRIDLGTIRKMGEMNYPTSSTAWYSLSGLPLAIAIRLSAV